MRTPVLKKNVNFRLLNLKWTACTCNEKRKGVLYREINSRLQLFLRVRKQSSMRYYFYWSIFSCITNNITHNISNGSHLNLIIFFCFYLSSIYGHITILTRSEFVLKKTQKKVSPAILRKLQKLVKRTKLQFKRKKKSCDHIRCATVGKAAPL